MGGADECNAPESGDHGIGATDILEGCFAEETASVVGKGFLGQLLAIRRVRIGIV